MEEKLFMDDWIRIEQMPYEGKLYHYTSLAGLKGIIENKEFWVTKSDFLNDKSEIIYISEIIDEVLQSNFKNVSIYLKLKNLFDEHWKKMILDNVFVLSFSTNPDSLTLWSEYSKYLGYNIGFKYGKLFEHINNFIWKGKVIYNREEQIRLLSEVLNYTLNELCKDQIGSFNTYVDYISYLVENNDDKAQNVFDHFCVICSVYAMFFKKECFFCEEEYRFVFWKYKEQVLFRESNQNVIIPYIRKRIISDSEHKLSIENITVAPKINIDIALLGMQEFLQDKGYNVPIVKSEIPLRY